MIMGFVAGLISRLVSLKSGNTHYPGYPSGYISQLALAVIAAMIGSSVLTALIGKQFTAATFLTLAATQFRDVRNTERNTLIQEEKLILVSRGPGYIEGIAITFEARNYLAMLVALSTSAITVIGGTVVGIIGGVIMIVIGEIFMSGRHIGDIIEVEPAKVWFDKGTLLYVDDVMMMEVGLPHPRERYEKEGLGVTLTPKNERGQAVLWNVSQRQAISYEAATAVGVQKDVGYPEQTPLCRMAMPASTGKAGLSILPVERDMDKLIRAIKRTPVLEASKWNRISSPVLNREEM
jgi:hypothetical protein